MHRLLALVVLAGTPAAAQPVAATAPGALDPSCLTAAKAPALEPMRDDRATFRIDRATSKVKGIDHDPRPAALPGRAVATIVHGQLIVRRDTRVLLAADPHGREIAWQIERDGMLIMSLYASDGAQTYDAVRLADAPKLVHAWCRVAANDGPGKVRGATATETGPLVVRSTTALAAIAPRDGAELWRIPWPESSGPFALIESSAGASVVCDREVVALDGGSGVVRWRHAFDPDVTRLDCTAFGRRIMFAWFRATDRRTVEGWAGALDATTGQVLWSAPVGDVGRPLVALAADSVLVARGAGIAVLDLRTGAIGQELAMAESIYQAEFLTGGDVLVHGAGTARIEISPLAVRWRVPQVISKVGEALFAAEAEATNGSARLLELDPKTGKVRRRIQLVRKASYFDVGHATIVGADSHSVDVETWFGFYE